jgi:hypothetical protein
MGIYRLLQKSAFAPGEYHSARGGLRTLKLSDRSDPVTEILAKKIIEIAQTGIRGFSPARPAGARGNPNFRPRISAGRQCAEAPRPAQW